MLDYKEKYNKLVEAVKALQEANPSDEGIRNWVNDNVPELKEHEDKRIKTFIKGLLLPHIEDIHLVGDKIMHNKDIDIYRRALVWLEKQGKPEDMGEVSDGYHTFNELYYYRMLYNAAFFNRLPKDWVHKSKRHHDGEECFGGGWFIVMANLPTGQISNHYELKDWDLFQIPEKDIADEWDGHTPQQAAERLHKYLLEKQGKCETDCPQNHQDVNHPNGCITMEDFNGGEGFYKLNIEYLNKRQVEEIEEIVRTWNKDADCELCTSKDGCKDEIQTMEDKE